MKKPNLVWSIFRKVIDRKNGIVNNNLKPTCLQITYFLDYQQLLIAFLNVFKMNDLVCYNYVNKSI